MNDFWKQQHRVDRLVELNDQGLSASQIARGIGEGCTRNMCIGKLRRLGIPLMGRTTGGENERVRSYARKPSAPRPKLAIVRQENVPAPEFVGPVGDFPPRGCCQYTPDDVSQPNWRMCGAPVYAPGTSWCSYHAYHGRPGVDLVYSPQRTQESNKKAAAVEAAMSAAQDRLMRRMGL